MKRKRTSALQVADFLCGFDLYSFNGPLKTTLLYYTLYSGYEDNIVTFTKLVLLKIVQHA